MEIGYTSWEKFSEGKTPGTTPLPDRIINYIPPTADKLIVDVGCGWGRVAVWLYLQGYSVIGTDINKNEVEKARQDVGKLSQGTNGNTISFQVDDASKHIALPDGNADGVTVNGVFLAMTKTDERTGLISEIYRILKSGGILYLAEFAQTSDEDYKVDYRKHALITGEYGTIVAFKQGLNISFKEKTDEEIKALGRPENIDYFSHHYSEEEIRGLLSKFKILELSKEKFTTRSGKRINGFVIYARKELVSK